MKKKMCVLVAMVLVLGSLLVPQMAFANDAAYVETVYVCTTDDGYLNMRSEPTTKNKNVIAEIPDCFAVDILYYNEDRKWGYGECFIENGHFEIGWIYMPMTRSTYEAARDNAGKAYQKTIEVASPDGELNLRKEPTGREYNILDVIYNGTVLNVTRRTDKGWGLVTYNGQKGWIKLDGYTKEYVAPTPTPASTSTPVVTSAPTQTPAVTPVPVQSGDGSKQIGNIRMEDDRIMSGNALVLTLIAVAIFLVVAVAVLLIVVLKRSKDASSEPYYPQNPDGYDGQNDAPYGNDGYVDPNSTPYGNEPYADRNGDPYGADSYNDPYSTNTYEATDNDLYNGSYGTQYDDESQQDNVPYEETDKNE